MPGPSTLATMPRGRQTFSALGQTLNSTPFMYVYVWMHVCKASRKRRCFFTFGFVGDTGLCQISGPCSCCSLSNACARLRPAGTLCPDSVRYACLSVCVSVCLHVYLFACMSPCVYVCMPVCLYVCLFVSVSASFVHTYTDRDRQAGGQAGRHTDRQRHRYQHLYIGTNQPKEKSSSRQYYRSRSAWLYQ